MQKGGRESSTRSLAEWLELTVCFSFQLQIGGQDRNWSFSTTILLGYMVRTEYWFIFSNATSRLITDQFIFVDVSLRLERRSESMLISWGAEQGDHPYLHLIRADWDPGLVSPLFIYVNAYVYMYRKWERERESSHLPSLGELEKGSGPETSQHIWWETSTLCHAVLAFMPGAKTTDILHSSFLKMTHRWRSESLCGFQKVSGIHSGKCLLCIASC